MPKEDNKLNQTVTTVQKVDGSSVKVKKTYDPTEEVRNLIDLQDEATQAEKDVTDLEAYYLAERPAREAIALAKRTLAIEAEQAINS